MCSDAIDQNRTWDSTNYGLLKQGTCCWLTTAKLGPRERYRIFNSPLEYRVKLQGTLLGEILTRLDRNSSVMADAVALAFEADACRARSSYQSSCCNDFLVQLPNNMLAKAAEDDGSTWDMCKTKVQVMDPGFDLDLDLMRKWGVKQWMHNLFLYHFAFQIDKWFIP